jgi:hypothetical protein
VTDALGIRRTILIGVTICVLARLAMVVTTNPYLAIGLGLLPVAIGEALCTPVLVAAMRKYTRAEQRPLAFSLFYAIMNLGFLIAYFVNDALQSNLGKTGIAIPLLEKPLSAQQALIGCSLFLELLLFPVVLLMRRNVEMTDKGLVVQSKEGSAAPASGLWAGIAAAGKESVQLFAKLLSQRAFYNLLIFLVLIGLLKLVFSLMDGVLPDFLQRELGDEGKSRLGRINGVNSLLILVLAPLAAIVTQRFSAYSMVVVGGFITAASFIFLALPPTTFQGASEGFLGKMAGSYLGIAGAVHPYFVMLILWQITLSVGEALYSPRVYEYASAIAPPGQEASYASLAYVPLLLGKIVSSGAFIVLLDSVYPKTGPSNPALLWTVIGGLVMAAPLTLLVLKRFIKVQEVGR